MCGDFVILGISHVVQSVRQAIDMSRTNPARLHDFFNTHVAHALLADRKTFAPSGRV